MTGAVRSRPWRRPLTGRDATEPHRAATPLELLFDLSFVVAVAAAAAELHHGIAEDHVGVSVLRYLMVFFAIWWAWMNFTWFASAYDTDDVPYRLLDPGPDRRRARPRRRRARRLRGGRLHRWSPSAT